jgi:hypothetical protein
VGACRMEAVDERDAGGTSALAMLGAAPSRLIRFVAIPTLRAVFVAMPSLAATDRSVCSPVAIDLRLAQVGLTAPRP